MMVSPGCTRAVNFTLISFLSPSMIRMIFVRLMAPFGVTPPASESACSTVVSDLMGYAAGFLTSPKM